VRSKLVAPAPPSFAFYFEFTHDEIAIVVGSIKETLEDMLKNGLTATERLNNSAKNLLVVVDRLNDKAAVPPDQKV
jgi:hypothetical protein